MSFRISASSIKLKKRLLFTSSSGPVSVLILISLLICFKFFYFNFLFYYLIGTYEYELMDLDKESSFPIHISKSSTEPASDGTLGDSSLFWVSSLISSNVSTELIFVYFMVSMRELTLYKLQFVQISRASTASIFNEFYFGL